MNKRMNERKEIDLDRFKDHFILVDFPSFLVNTETEEVVKDSTLKKYETICYATTHLFCINKSLEKLEAEGLSFDEFQKIADFINLQNGKYLYKISYYIGEGANPPDSVLLYPRFARKLGISQKWQPYKEAVENPF